MLIFMKILSAIALSRMVQTLAKDKSTSVQVPLLLTWFNFNPSMDK